jgi:alanine dehydrogenase
MVLVLTRDDLRPLVESDEQLLRAMDRLERAILHQRNDPPDRSAELEFDLTESGPHRLRTTPLPDAITVRWFPVDPDSPFTPNGNVWLLFGPGRGELLALLAADELNVLRTALPAAVGVRRLAAPGASILTLFGSGRLARGCLHALRPAMPELQEVRVCSPAAIDLDRFASEASDRYGLDVRATGDPRQAVTGAEVVATLEGFPQQLEVRWLAPGSLVVQTDTGSAPEGLRKISRVVVPVRPPQTTELDLADLIQGLAPAREQSEQIVLWDLSAPRPWDPPVANWAYKWALEQGVGTQLDLTGQSPPAF